MQLLISVLIATVLCIMPALTNNQAAAEGNTTTMPSGYSFDWSGGYFGAQLGGVIADQGIDLFNPNAAVSLRRSWSPSPEGVAGGIFAGYNWQKDSNFVFGVEAEYNWADADGSDRVVSPTLGLGPVVDRIDVDINRTAAIRGRVGYAVDRTLLYVTAGWAWIDHDGAYTISVAGLTSNPRSWSRHDHGWTLGGGAEHAFTQNLVGRIDYRYSNFGEVDYGLVGPPTYLSGDLETHDIRAGIAVRF